MTCYRVKPVPSNRSVNTHTFLLLYELNQLLQDFVQNPADTNQGGKHRDEAGWAGMSNFLLLASCLPKERQPLMKMEVKSQTWIFKLAHAVHVRICSHAHTNSLSKAWQKGTNSTCFWCWSSCPDVGVWVRGVWRGMAAPWASLHQDLSTQTCTHTYTQLDMTWSINSPLKPRLPKDKKSRSQKDVLQCATVPLSEISRVAIEETRGKSSWITAAPAALSWKDSERQRGKPCAQTWIRVILGSVFREIFSIFPEWGKFMDAFFMSLQAVGSFVE